MDGTTRLIKIQRLTITLLILTAVSTLVFARITTVEAEDKDNMILQLADERNAADLREIHASQQHQKIIHDLEERLRRYEAKYGKIEPRRGEGECAANQGLKPQVDR